MVNYQPAPDAPVPDAPVPDAPVPDAPVIVPPSLTTARRLKAPVEKVFAAWTDPKILAQWWGPHHTRVVEAAMDVREGGGFRIVLGEANGARHEISGRYVTVEPNARLVFTWAWSIAPERQSRVTISFRAVADGTEVTVLHDMFADADTATRHRRGWTESLDRLVLLFGEVSPGA
jgi:uncharacterized protein YndB with AHSA1/START domain